MLDYLIKGGTIVDGTGAPGFTGDVGVRDGRVTALGARIGEPAAETIDAAGLVVAPGFIDPHTHYDAQLCWDPFATPSNVHGVTTVMSGNCGFTLAPLRERDADYIRRMMAKVEGMSLAALETGADWNWESFGDYLDVLEGRIAVNAGFMVGHCALRRYVMGPRAVGGEADEAELAEMARLLHASIEAGGMGLSTTLSHTHSDGDGEPVPSRSATREELIALSRATGEHEGTTLEGAFEGCLDTFSDEEIDLVTAMSAAAGRPLNWNVLTIDSRSPDTVRRQLEASAAAAAAGGRVVALTMPVLVPMNMSLGTFCALNLLPGWGNILGLPIDRRITALRDPLVQAGLLERARSPEAGVFRRLADFGRYVIGDTYSAENEGLTGRVVEEVAAERGLDPFQALVDIAAADGLRTVLWPMPPDNDPASWRLRQVIWENEHVMLGGSDAGAHLDRMCGAPYTTRFLGDTLRGRRLVSLERAVQMITRDPARLFGLRGRGTLAEGGHADIVLFDPATVGAENARLVHDLPGGGPRLTAGSTGVVRVLVGGVETVRDGAATGATPGTVLRSGRDTATVTTSGKLS
ncbi:N-acyl-D-amino-acid deacylase family protein [Spirillospora sp. CA-142024]|uniref:N-acyl-D-amino-acid deacylase family protein n=1 Tax=Spirillospora sp. CA-142024 TaxID=3240036 RepID=UPI003D8F2536